MCKLLEVLNRKCHLKMHRPCQLQHNPNTVQLAPLILFKTWLRISTTISQLSCSAKEITEAVRKDPNAHSSGETIMIFLWSIHCYSSPQAADIKNIPLVFCIDAFTFELLVENKPLGAMTDSSLIFTKWGFFGFDTFVEMKLHYQGWAPGATHLYLKHCRMQKKLCPQCFPQLSPNSFCRYL